MAPAPADPHRNTRFFPGFFPGRQALAGSPAEIDALDAATVLSMLVDALLLRRDGIKKSQAELRISVPMRLTLTVRREVYSAPPVDEIVAILSRGEHEPPFLDSSELRGAALTRLRGDSFVIIGRELMGRRPNHRYVPQAWWCRVVLDDKVPPGMMEPIEETYRAPT